MSKARIWVGLVSAAVWLVPGLAVAQNAGPQARARAPQADARNVDAAQAGRGLGMCQFGECPLGGPGLGQGFGRGPGFAAGGGNGPGGRGRGGQAGFARGIGGMGPCGQGLRAGGLDCPLADGGQPAGMMGLGGRGGQGGRGNRGGGGGGQGYRGGR